MRRRLFLGAFGAAILTMALAAPVLAHGDHDARPLARQLPAGPHSISLWQVYPDVGSAMTPHLIVMFDGERAAPPAAVVTVVVNGAPMAGQPSMTTANGWETSDGLDEGDVVAVTVTEGGQTWALDPVVVPPPPMSMLPMSEMLYASIFLTIATALWVASRTGRAWRRPAVAPRTSVATQV